MSDELNVWRRAREGYNSQTNPYPTAGMDAAAAAIRDYGDKRYQQAIADVVEWLGECSDTHEAVALDIARNALGDGFYNADAATRYRAAANEITRRFGKGQDHG